VADNNNVVRRASKQNILESGDAFEDALFFRKREGLFLWQYPAGKAE
jgi:hypothetical protein